jgi:hypothetical protein
MQPGEPGDRSPEPGVTPPPPQPPEVAPPPALAPPPTDGWASPASGQPSPSGRRPTTIIVGAIGLVAALAVAIGLKVAPFIAAGVLGSALAGAFGGPWDRLPEDVQRGYEQRLEAALGDQLDGLADGEKARRLEALIKSGMPRLGDARLVERLGLQTAALRSTSESVCAAFGRKSIGGQTVDADTAEAMFGSLATDQLIALVNISVEAIEAEAFGAPEPVFASEAETAVLIEAVFATMAEADIQTIAAMSEGSPTTDAEVCSAIRSLYGGVDDLDPSSQVIMARIDVQP